MSGPGERRRFDELAHRELDGDLTAGERAALDELCAVSADLAAARAALGRTRAATRVLAEERPEPSAGFAAEVMRRLEQPRPRSLWDFILRPRVIRVRPLVAVAGGLALALVGVLAPRGRAPVATPPAAAPLAAASQPASAPAPAACDGDVVLVRFLLPARGARQVALAGDFNGWSTRDTLLADQQGSGVFSVTVPLRRGGTYAYKFVVDGRWVDDPLAEAHRPDGFGERNSLLRL